VDLHPGELQAPGWLQPVRLDLGLPDDPVAVGGGGVCHHAGFGDPFLPLCFFIAAPLRAQPLHVADPGDHSLLDQHGHPHLRLVSDSGAGAALCQTGRRPGLHPPGAPLYPNAFAVYLGMVSMFLPFVTLPLYASVERLDWALVEAAQDLYASRVRVFTQAILPQTLPGLSVGIILTFVPAMGMFVVPDLLGGAKYMLVGNLIQQQFGASRDWPFGAAISMGLMVLTMISLQIYRRKGKEIEYV
jgi:ABC-type dipeptide/oligopeptide/nickel transport system permease subunit